MLLIKQNQIIIQELLQQNLARIYWDIDTSFIEDQIHDAGLFIRSHKTQWHYYNNESFNWLLKLL